MRKKRTSKLDASIAGEMPRKSGKKQESNELGGAARQDAPSLSQLVDIDSVKIAPRQPRRYFDPQKLEQLASSIREYGILEPLIVRPIGTNTYELVAGERRYRAAKGVGLEKIPVIVRELDENEAYELALLENLQRDDLNPIDETEGLLELLSRALKLTPQEIIKLLNRAANAQKRGKVLTNNETRQIQAIDKLFLNVGRLNRESFRTNRLPLLNLPTDVLVFLRQGELEYTKAKAIARVPDSHQRKQLMQQVVDEHLSLSELKKRIRQFQEQHGVKTPKDLREEFKSITRLKSGTWNDMSKRKRLEKLLSELRDVLEVEA